MKQNIQSGTVTEIRIAKGVLKVSRKDNFATNYTFKNNGTAARVIIVEHPNSGERWRLTEPETPAERTANHYRFDLPAPAGAAVTFSVHEERSYVDSLALVNSNRETLAVYTSSPEATAPVRAALEEVASRSHRLADLKVRVADLDAQIQAISKGQERIRKNMEALDHKSDLYRRYVGELDKQETQIGALTAERDARQAEMTSAHADLSSYVAGLNL